MTVPPEPEPQQQRQVSFPTATLPVPGNAELLVYLLVVALFAIVWAAADTVNAGDFVLATAIVTFAYLISRGIAKASRVYEH